MNLERRTEKLKSFLSTEKDRVFLQSLRNWHVELMDNYMASGIPLNVEESKELLLKYFPGIRTNAELLGKMTSILELLSSFETLAVMLDGLNYLEAGYVVQDVLDELVM